MNNIDICEEFEEVVNEKSAKQPVENRGRKLTAKKATFNLDEGTYNGTITNTFWYKKDGRDRVMFEYHLDDGKEFVMVNGLINIRSADLSRRLILNTLKIL